MITNSATYCYTEERLPSNNLQTKYSEGLEQISYELIMEDGKVDSDQITANPSTTDLVRLYLREIGRVDLLEKDQEVSKAQKVQRYLQLLELRNKAAKKEKKFSVMLS